MFRANTSDTTGDWADPPVSSSEYAHEVGHILGQFDEYVGGVKDPSGLQPQPAPEVNLMAGTGPALLVRHYRWALRFLNSNTGGDPYNTCSGDTRALARRRDRGGPGLPPSLLLDQEPGEDGAPRAVAGTEASVEVGMGDNHACVRNAGGQVRCWGWNQQGQLGATPTTRTRSGQSTWNGDRPCG